MIHLGRAYRRGLLFLLGGVLLLPYAALAVIFADLFRRDEAPAGIVALLVVLAAAIGAVPPFLGPMRALEIVSARLLLDVDLPDPPRPSGLSLESRLRSALWFVLHLALGGLLIAALVFVVPLALGVLTGQADLGIGGFCSYAGALGLLTVVGFSVAGLGGLTARLAPVLLGPSPAEQIQQLQAEARKLAERNRLARDLHDSMGHALTLTVVQAAAARELLDSDPEFARRALTAIEDSGREAMEQLDHALGVLREQDQPTLADLSTLGSGLRGELVVSGIEAVPASVSREARTEGCPTRPPRSLTLSPILALGVHNSCTPNARPLPSRTAAPRS